MMQRGLLIGLMMSICGMTTAAHEPSTWPVGMKALHRLDLLPELRRSVEFGSISSYDRSGGNDDGFSGKYSSIAKEDGCLVIADLKGPGVIYRIWTPTPTDDLMEFYFDGEATPRITVRFRELFTGSQPPFTSPLVGYGAGGFFSYVPLAYRKSCKVKVRGERVQFYQINFARYPENAPIHTWQASLSAEQQQDQQKASALFSSVGSDISRHVVAAGSELRTHKQRVLLGPGQTVTLFQTSQGGRIAGLRLSPASALEGKGRDLLLRIHWDDETKPAVLCPAGDFFGFAWGRQAMTSLLVGSADDHCYCYFPMPFERSAKIELVSERKTGPPVEVQAEILHSSIPRAENEGKFYARWHRENPTKKGVPFTFLDAQGSGHIVGCIQQAQGMVSGNTLFFEGDDQTTVDGKLVVHGTGSEDFYNGGWYDVPGRWEKRLSFPLSGCLGYQKYLGRTGGYRLMLGDAYPFQSSILQTIEHAATNNDRATDYCGVTYVYLKSTPSWDQTIAPVAARRVIDFKKIIFTPSWYMPIYAFTFRGATLTKKDEQIDGKKVGFLSMQAEGKDWFGEPFISLTCDIPAAGEYRVSIETVKGPGQALVQLFENEAPVSDAVDFYASKRERSGLAEMGTMTLNEGSVNLMFKLTGKNVQAEGLGFDLITVQFDRVE